MFKITKNITQMLFVGLLGLLGACGSKKPQLPVSVEQLATQIDLPLGTKMFHLPLIALVSNLGNAMVYQSSKLSSDSHAINEELPVSEVIRNYSSNPVPMLGLGYAEIRLNTFAYLKAANTDTTVSTTGLCPLLKQKWAFELCHNGMIDGWNMFWPESFTLMDEQYLRKIRPTIGYYAGRSGSTGDDVLKMAPYTFEPKMYCGIGTDGQKSNLCTVVMRLDKQLLAIWVTTDLSITNHGIALEANSVRLFLEHGAGEKENYEALRRGLRGLHQRLNANPRKR